MFKSRKEVSLSEVFALINWIPLDIYQEYVSQIQGYRW